MLRRGLGVEIGTQIHKLTTEKQTTQNRAKRNYQYHG